MSFLNLATRRFILLVFLCLPSCQFNSLKNVPTPQQEETTVTKPTKSQPSASAPPKEKKEAPALPSTKPKSNAFPPQIHRVQSKGVELTLLSYDSRTHQLRITDKVAGLQTSPYSSEQAAKAVGGIAAINGGFFDLKGAPLGKVRSSNKNAGSWNRHSSLTSGVYQNIEGGRPSLTRQTSANRSAKTLLQTGPFLLENGNMVSGLNNARKRSRSFLLWDGSHRWALGYCSQTSLQELSQALRDFQKQFFPVKYALNLDGGRSSDLWVSPELPQGGFSTRKLWNKSVRNYLVLTKR